MVHMKKLLQLIIFIFLCVTFAGIYMPQVLADGDSTSSVGNPPQISAQTAVLIDAKTMQIFYQKDMHSQMYPASITKIMTGLLVAEYGNPNDVVTVQNDVGNSQGKSVSCIGLSPVRK